MFSPASQIAFISAAVFFAMVCARPYELICFSSGKAALSETHAWLFANILDIDPAEVVANTKLEHAISTGNNLKAKFWQEQLDKIFSESMPIKIQIAQINPIVGDIQSNAKKIIDLSIEAFDLGAHLVVFPELALTGYPPEDLLLRDGFMDQVKNEVDNLCEAIPSNISVLFGAPSQSDKNLYNSAYLIRDNQIQNIYNKQELPNYGVFDEKRYFTPGSDSFVFECQNTRIGVLICEDQWIDRPIRELCQSNVELVISLNASPFQLNKQSERINICQNYALEFGISFVYINLVGGQDEVVFDGNSFVMNDQGQITLEMPAFEEMSMAHNDSSLVPKEYSDEATIYSAIVLATRDYIKKNSFSGALIGLSGGIDSALTLAIAVDAIGPENVHAVMMPYQYTSEISLADSKQQALTQGVKFSNVDIHSMVDSFNRSLSDLFENNVVDTTEENIQKVLNYIHDNIENSSLNVEKLSSHLCLSRSQVYRKIKALTGLSPIEFIRRVRLERSRTIFQNDKNLNVSEVAHKVGFLSASYFTVCYKKQFGELPKGRKVSS